MDVDISPSRGANLADEGVMSNMSDILVVNPADFRDKPERTSNNKDILLCARGADSIWPAL